MQRILFWKVILEHGNVYLILLILFLSGEQELGALLPFWESATGSRFDKGLDYDL
jgi:hypothetical protein